MLNEKDNVANYLAPTRLIKPTHKPKAAKLTGQDSRYSTHSHPLNAEAPPAYQSQLTRDHTSPLSKEYQSQISPIGRIDEARNSKLKRLHESVTHQQPEEYAIGSGQREEPNSSFKLYKVQQEEEQPGEIHAKFSQSIAKSQASQRSGGFPEFNTDKRESNASPAVAPTLTVDSLTGLIEELKGVKLTLQSSLLQLQGILDNTSKFLADVDSEYARIKQHILDYTSQVLDSSFARYRSTMVDWTKYEQIERKAITMSQQLQRTIREEEVMVGEIGKMGRNSRIIVGKQAEISEQIDLYTRFNHELQGSKAECLSMRPQLSRERVGRYEEALAGLCDF